MTANEVFEFIRQTKAKTGIIFSGGTTTLATDIEIYQLPREINKIITRSMWEKIKVYKGSHYKFNGAFYESHAIRKTYSEVIEKAEATVTREFVQYLDSNRDSIIKLIEARLKQLNLQAKKTSDSNKKKTERLEEFHRVLTALGYQVSKVYNANLHYSYGNATVSDRKTPNKYHKYITTSVANIKFATLEVKINKDSYSIGVKFETSGEIGCSFEYFTNTCRLIAQEKEILDKALSKLKL